MKKLLFLFFILCISQVFAQVKSNQKKIQEVENNLIPFVPVKDFDGWNILDRMKYDLDRKISRKEGTSKSRLNALGFWW